jgi:hypothetical protein
MSDDNEPAWYSPDRKPRPPRQPQPPDAVLWTIRVDYVEWCSELRFHDIGYLPFEIRIVRDGDFHMSQFGGEF